MTARYDFKKPNDGRALHLMNEATVSVVKELQDIIIAYGQSDEVSFVLHPSCELFQRREAKLITTVVSMFTASYVMMWPKYFPDTVLETPLPSFDGRAVAYPSVQNLRDYMSWRQVDCHINNLYNTAFWSLVNLGGLGRPEAEKELRGTFSEDKNEMLFSRFGINYNNEPEMFKKGSVVFRNYNVDTPGAAIVTHTSKETSNQIADEELKSAENVEHPPQSVSKRQLEKERRRRLKAEIVIRHIDIIQDGFWNERPWILTGRSPKATTMQS